MNAPISEDEIVEGWSESIQTAFEQFSPLVRKERERLRTERPIRVWLGGPRNGSPLYRHGSLLSKLLCKEGCVVETSSADVVSEIAEAEPSVLAQEFDLLFLVVASPGTSAEAMELTLGKKTKGKLHVFIPEEYREGYLVRSLGDRHKMLCGPSFFSLAGAQSYNCQLARNMVFTLVKQRNYCIQEDSIQPQSPVIQVTGNQTQIHMQDININKPSGGSTVVSNSTVTKSFNTVQTIYGSTTADALKSVRDHVAKSDNKEAGELLDVFSEELEKPQPRKAVLKNVWEKVCQLVPSVTELAKACVEIGKLFSGSGQ